MEKTPWDVTEQILDRLSTGEVINYCIAMKDDPRSPCNISEFWKKLYDKKYKSIDYRKLYLKKNRDLELNSESDDVKLKKMLEFSDSDTPAEMNVKFRKNNDKLVVHAFRDGGKITVHSKWKRVIPYPGKMNDDLYETIGGDCYKVVAKNGNKCDIIYLDKKIDMIDRDNLTPEKCGELLNKNEQIIIYLFSPNFVPRDNLALKSTYYPDGRCKELEIEVFGDKGLYKRNLKNRYNNFVHGGYVEY